jgi:hypothetical protein
MTEDTTFDVADLIELGAVSQLTEGQPELEEDEGFIRRP